MQTKKRFTANRSLVELGKEVIELVALRVCYHREILTRLIQ